MKPLQLLVISLVAFSATIATGQITSIPPITTVPTYGTPVRGQPAPWRRGGGLFGRRATVGAPGVVQPGVVVPGASCSTPPVTVSPGTVVPSTTVPADSGWQPVTPSAPAPSVPSSVVPSTGASATTAQRVITYYAPAPQVGTSVAPVPVSSPVVVLPATPTAPQPWRPFRWLGW